MSESETSPQTKVVGITTGKPVNVEPTTSSEIMDLIELTRSIASGEKHLAVGMFLVDETGRCWTQFRLESGSGLDSVGAVTILKSRIVDEYERACK